MSLWNDCLSRMESELSPDQFNTWLRPLHALENPGKLTLLAPNRFVADWVKEEYLERISEIASFFSDIEPVVKIEVGTGHSTKSKTDARKKSSPVSETASKDKLQVGRLNPGFTFNTHVEGKSNQFARAATAQVGENPGTMYNPLFIYGGVGLGKTHLMQAAGNYISEHDADAQVAYLTAEDFVNDMVRSIRQGKMDQFKKKYRSQDALLIDDIQFLASKNQSQEEFFHTYNALVDNRRQIIITSDRIPAELNNIQDRLISRFSSGLTVRVDAPEEETRVAIVKKKAMERGIDLPDHLCFYIAKHVKSNVRVLEGALYRVIAKLDFAGLIHDPDMALVNEALSEVLGNLRKTVSISEIQRTVCEMKGISMSDMLSKKRNRQYARPRQIAMSLSKELTNHSLPEIGRNFGDRDHTTVLHACRKVDQLRTEDKDLEKEYLNLKRLMSS
ncbi:MAG: chromosomal replication initiator protein DnaA [Gammaproteobacteria bacterium]|nr:MAG: chromosomal replication initiator protein DnaA [Gammaproteobacteria bacterium]